MESNPTTDSSAAAVALGAAEASRAQLVRQLVLPSAFFPSIGAAVAVQIASAAIGISTQDLRGLLLAVAGMLAFALTAAIQLARFRRCNGVWLAGLMSRVVVGGSTTGSAAYAAAFGAALWAAFSDAWWLTAIAAAVGGLGYALAGCRWLAVYRSAPADHGRPGSRLWLAIFGVAALAGIVALVLQS
jgi:hypothetical protein